MSFSGINLFKLGGHPVNLLFRFLLELTVLGLVAIWSWKSIEGWAGALRAALPQIWNADLRAYDAKNLRTGEFAGVLGSGAFLAYLAQAGRPELDAELRRVWDAVTYGIPSADPQADIFDPRRYWRGPTWPVVNALMALGFLNSGHADLEARLRRETAQLIEKHGFYEYFESQKTLAKDLTSGYGGGDFSWTAACAVDLFIENGTV